MRAMRLLYLGALAVLTSAALFSQEDASPVSSTPPATDPGSAAASSQSALDYVCPMDRDIRSKTPGFCPRCGMKLVPGIPEFREYAVTMSTLPRALKAGKKTRLSFQ